MIRPALIAAALLIATPAFAEPGTEKYALDIAVVHDGVQVVSTRTQIIEDAPTSASVTVGDARFEFEANLSAVQGDGDAAQLSLEAHISNADGEIAAPRLTFLRGKEARIEVGREDGDLLRMIITPIE